MSVVWPAACQQPFPDRSGVGHRVEAVRRGNGRRRRPTHRRSASRGRPPAVGPLNVFRRREAKRVRHPYFPPQRRRCVAERRVLGRRVHVVGPPLRRKHPFQTPSLAPVGARPRHLPTVDTGHRRIGERPQHRRQPSRRRRDRVSREHHDDVARAEPRCRCSGRPNSRRTSSEPRPSASPGRVRCRRSRPSSHCRPRSSP